jgi:hypothetical protein
VCDVDPLDLVETIREDVVTRDPDLTVRLVQRCFGDVFTVTRKGIPHDKEGRQ